MSLFISCLVAWDADILEPDILIILSMGQARSPQFTVIGQNVIRPHPHIYDWSLHHFSIPPARQEVNIVIFIIFYGISPSFNRYYLVHMIFNQHPCQPSRHSDDKLWYSGPVRSGRVKHELFDRIKFGLIWHVKISKDRAIITLHCILMIYWHISMR